MAEFKDDWSSFQKGAKTEDRTIPRFFTQPVELTFKSKQEGRPVYEDREFVEILVPGNPRSTPVESVNEDHKARWRRDYEAFKNGLELAPEGTPLEHWPPIGRATALNLKAANVFTVEQLAELPDAALQYVGTGGYELRRQAKLFVDVARDGTGPLARVIAENEKLKADVAMKDQQLSQQGDTIAALRAELAAKGKGKAHA